MERHRVTIIDLNPDGTVRPPERTPLSARIGRIAILIAVVAVLVAVAAFAVFALAIAIPIALGAGLVAWATMRYRAWRGDGGLSRPGA